MNIPDKQPLVADTKYAREAWIRALERTASIERLGVTLPVLIGRLAQKFDTASAPVSTEATLSYRELAIRCNKYARWGLATGLRPGDAVGLMMPNFAEYMSIWLGLTRIGVVVALINNNLAGDALVHSINIVVPRAVIAGSHFASRLIGARARLESGLSCLVHRHNPQDLQPLAPTLPRLPAHAVRD